SGEAKGGPCVAQKLGLHRSGLAPPSRKHVQCRKDRQKRWNKPYFVYTSDCRKAVETRYRSMNKSEQKWCLIQPHGEAARRTSCPTATSSSRVPDLPERRISPWTISIEKRGTAEKDVQPHRTLKRHILSKDSFHRSEKDQKTISSYRVRFFETHSFKEHL
ncbi:hypothetical protein, partial [Cereibacter sphaeroides]|uniref:hypothetical protein n=1 Tax=Cereibacter sphaeroides TaxID=1063 RepID=UPI001F43EE90